jgi:hypothetical protein
LTTLTRRFCAGRAARFGALALALALGGCVEQAVEVSPDLAAQRPIERREGVSLAEATVAIVSVDGAPAAVAEDFSKRLTREVQSQNVVIAEAGKAKYLVRGYLSAGRTAEGASIEYVWDVFGPDKRREMRISDGIEVKGSDPDPWAMAGDAALNSIAAKSADDLAAFLSNTRDAKPQASSAPATTAALGYAPTE